MGLPAYKGSDLIQNSLDCLQRQTFRNFQVIISVDGSDMETAAACRPFLSDPRFRLVIHPQRLDWVGNFNWLLRQDLQEFFCYRQHDDVTTTEFFEALLQAADQEPDAAAVYCDCQYTGISNFIEIAESIGGEPLDRLKEFIERLPKVHGPALRGLIRRPAIRQAGHVRTDEFRAPLQIHGWLAKLLRWGSFKRHEGALYYRLDRPDSFTRKFMGWAEDKNQAINMWTTLFTGLLDAVMPLCQSPEQRLFFQRLILDRTIMHPVVHNTEPSSKEKIIAACEQRLRAEGNLHLLRTEEFTQIVQLLNLPLPACLLPAGNR